MNQSISQGIERLSELSLDETEALIASAYAEFETAEAAGDVETMKATLAAAKTATQHKAVLTAAAADQDTKDETKADRPRRTGQGRTGSGIDRPCRGRAGRRRV